MVALSKEAGRFYDVLMGIPFAVIGGRSSPSHEDRARAKLLFEAECLRMYAKPMALSCARFYNRVRGIKLNATLSIWSKLR